MSVASDHVPVFRDLWADRFVDTASITDLTDRGTYNPATLQYDTPSTSVVYSGGVLIRATKGDQIEERGMSGEMLYTHTILLPHSATGISVGNTVTVTASVYDPDLVGAVLTVQSVHQDTYNTRRELRCLLSQGRGDRG